MTTWNMLAGKNNNQVSIRYLIVGGGGSASACLNRYNAGGGGGGGFYDQSNNIFNTGVPYYIKVGAGGVWSNNVLAVGNNGDYSQFHTDVVGGGQGAFRGGLTGQGGAAGAYGNTTAGTGNAGQSFLDGRTLIPSNPGWGLVSSQLGQANTGIGGSSPGGIVNVYGPANAFDGTLAVVGLRAAGLTSNITGSSVVYCDGGYSMYNDGRGTNGVRGGGGNAADYWYVGTNKGGNGGNGMVIIRHSSSLLPAYTTGNPTITTTGGYMVYTWSTPGTYTVVFQ